MSAHAFILTASRSPVLFTGLMTDDKQTLANGLRRRDPDLLDRLIERANANNADRCVILEETNGYRTDRCRSSA